MTQRKRLYSIGDSFMTVDDPADGIFGFCALYCDRKNFEHISLARPGATNFAIRLQIDKAIKDKADYVVMGLTSSDRFDIELPDAQYTAWYTLHNVFYKNYRANSEHNVDQSDVKIVSDTFNNIVERTYTGKLLDDKKIQALKYYIANLHCASIAAQKDYYMISDGIAKLQKYGIDLVLIPGWMQQFDWTGISRLWPSDRSMPYDMPYGPAGWYQPPKFTGTHNPCWAHEEFCETLLSITTDWS